MTNDVGPVVKRDGLLRIGSYIGVEPAVPTLNEVSGWMLAAMLCFARVPPLCWQEETLRHYVQLAGRVGLTCDPALRQVLRGRDGGPVA